MKIGDVLISWYRKNKRTLPWRETREPYLIWISEIILQQTRIAQGLSYYLRFVKTFPDIETLANADIDDVLKLWQGLGYYSRARNMHNTAKEIVRVYKGVFPTSSSRLKELKGIGSYTSAAIASICYNEKIPVVDGNVIRLVCRLEAINEPIGTGVMNKKVFAIAESYMQKHSPGEINQAMMEFGALQCVPGKADCEICPLKKYCRAYKMNMVDILPVKKNKTRQKSRYFNYFIIVNNDHTILSKRSENDIWRGLYEFPLIETSSLETKTTLSKNEDFLKLINSGKVKIKKMGKNLKHILSHQIIHASFYILKGMDLKKTCFNESEIVNVNQINSFPVSKLIEKFIETEWKNCVSLKVK